MKFLTLVLVLIYLLISVSFVFTQTEDEDYNHFLSLVQQYFEERSLNAQVYPDYVTVLGSELYPESYQFGLTNLAQICLSLDRSEWYGIITDHFQKIAEIIQEQNNPSFDPSNYEQVKSIILPRIYPTVEFPQFNRQLNLLN
jgi:hypothetical protein